MLFFKHHHTTGECTMRGYFVVFLMLTLPLAASAQLAMSGPGYPDQMGFHAYQDGSYTHADITSNQTNTGPNGVSFSGPLTPGDVAGFDYSFTYNSTAYVRQYRHTITAADTHRSLITSLGAQWKADPIVQAAIGADIVTYAWLRQITPTAWSFQFFESWPFVDTGNPQITIYTSPGAAVVGAGLAGNKTLEANPYWACGRTTIGVGRQPRVGDRLCNTYITGDVTGRALDQRNVDQTYAQLEYSILDPTPGVYRAKAWWHVDTLDLDVNHILIKGQPIGPVGLPGPPGGNVAGSVVQSPALTICAGQNQANDITNCAATRVYKLDGLSITGWRTLATLTPSNVSGSWSAGKVKVEVQASTNGAGIGIREAQAYVSVANGAPTTGWFGATGGTVAGAAPQFRLITTGNVVEVQIASPNGSNYIASGFAKIEYMLSDAEGVPVTWTIQ